MATGIAVAIWAYHRQASAWPFQHIQFAEPAGFVTLKSLLDIRWIALPLLTLGILWLALFVYRHASQRSPDLLVCEGEREGNCPAHTNFMKCDSDIDAFAKTLCRKYTVIPAAEASKAGEQCGYKITRVICERIRQ
ncbi:hypothetical protein SAMN05216337_10887 [Bradyrhizobium brasilense]|uniref:Uncharacterized protein n=1 Tax=Bradyrhizobium brasilense TaxID=1419277 RepID=A0A1G7Q019_9BRAD|nr:hypothetical protein [Bradyrhizobium brasilense]SDF91813.1 hypothetical protein SAMN05216337_10887 [Bradyrhizobium brasilense]